jgi:N-acetylated-alpha-linked acidic dipeptidase
LVISNFPESSALLPQQKSPASLRCTPRNKPCWKINSKLPISTEEIRKQHRYFTSIPHPLGSVHDHEVAQYIADLWKKQGLEDVVIRQYDVLGTRPISTSLEMVAPSHYQASLREAAYDVDPDTKNPEVANAWMGYSSSGEVTAPVVYAHSGNPEDRRDRNK